MTDDPADDDDIRLNQAGANYEVQFAIHLRDKSMEQSISMGAWLVASLLVLNGGGALAVLNAVERISNPLWPASIFVAGIMFALANAVGVQWSGYAMLRPMSELIGYWLAVANDGVRLIEHEEMLNKKMRPLMIRARIASVLGWLSALLFLAGCISFAMNFVEKSLRLNKTASTTEN